MKTNLIYKATLAALLGLGMLSACDSDSDSEGSADTENPTASDTDVDPSDTDPDPSDTDASDTDASDTDASDTDGSDTDVDPSDTDDSDTDVDTTVGPADCSCFDPAANEGLDIDESCVPLEEALPGCAIEPSPCDPIVQEFGAEDQINDRAPVDCVAAALANGERPHFIVSLDDPQGDDTTNYVPLPDGSYVARNCGFYDNPPEYQSVEALSVADDAYFAECVSAYAKNISGDALFECLMEGLTEAPDAFPACE